MKEKRWIPRIDSCYKLTKADAERFAALCQDAKRWGLCRAACTKPLLYAGTDY